MDGSSRFFSAPETKFNKPMNIAIHSRISARVILLITLLALSSLVGAYAQELRYDQKYLERTQKSQGIESYSVSSFGERLSLKNGGVEFNWIDIDIPGNSALPVRLQRTLVIEDQSVGRSGNLGGFGVGGSLDIPYLKGIFLTSGWQVLGSSPNARCSVYNDPPGTTNMPSIDFWSGNWLHLPGGNEQLMLSAINSPLPSPTDDTNYAWITRDFWRLSCLPTTKNGYPGESFVALSPNGEKYYFDWAVTKPHPSLSKRIGNYSSTAHANRVAVYFLVSRIEDRFGNWVNYTYSGDQLSRIEASDGRYIQVSTMSGANITAVESSLGKWAYTYSSDTLTVTRPDGSQSQYMQTGKMLMKPTSSLPVYIGTPTCPLPELSTGEFSYQITLPSNVTATFEFQAQRHYIHNVPKRCHSFMDAKGPSSSYQYLSIPNFMDSFTLTTKTISGPGLPMLAWTYKYGIGAKPLAFESRCSASTGSVCPKTIQTEVRGPNLEMQRHTFGNWFRYNNGQDMGVETGLLAGASAPESFNVLSKTENEYVTSEEIPDMPFPGQVGPSIMSDYVVNAGLRPLKRRTTRQQGQIHQLAVNAFDAFARPVSTNHSSAIED